MRVGVLTGGGDCPGLNAVIRAVVRVGAGTYGHTHVGIRHGWRGLTIDVRAEVEGQLADCLHFIRRATGRTATRVEVIELLLAEHLPSEPGDKGTITPAASRSGRKRVNEVFYRRLVNAYIWEFSARAYYGNGGTTLGSTRESASVNMNGRQARLNMRLAYDSGGAPIAPRLSWQCKTYVSDDVCGQNGASSNVYTLGSWGIPQQTDYRGSNGRYYYRFFWKFLAQGRPGCSGGVYINPKEASGILTCGNFSPGACQFRDGATEARPAEPGC